MQSIHHIPSVAVVILNWNGRHHLEKFLPSVMATRYENLSVVVADNCSSDDSISFLQQNYPSINRLNLDKNYGFAEGYNRALQKLTAEYFVLLNSDVEVSENWIMPIIELMESNKNIAVCQPKILSEKNKNLFEYAGASGGWLDKYGYPFCRGRVFDYCEEDLGQYDDTSKVFWASGACLFIRPHVFEKVGGFDPFFFAHQEEIDLCWRVQNAGYEVYVQPKSVVYHLGGGSLETGNPRKLFLNFRNNLIMLQKNLHPKNKFRIMFVRMSLDWLAAMQFLSKGMFSSFIAIMKAHTRFFKWLFMHKRSRTDRKKLYELEGIYEGSIVRDYFIRKKKIFSEIVENKK